MDTAHSEKSTTKSKLPWILLVVGLVLGALIVLAVRFATYNPHNVHYHANFAVYINGQRQTFKDPSYYQDVAICTSSSITTPLERSHMHDGVNDIVHVHDSAVTWEQFFNNLGWGIGPTYLQTRDHLYVNGGAMQVHYILNGQDVTGVTDVANTVIQDKSKLLVSYGNVSAPDLQKEYDAIPSTAAKEDTIKDPASCSGSEKVTLSDRFHHLF